MTAGCLAVAGALCLDLARGILLGGVPIWSSRSLVGFVFQFVWATVYAAGVLWDARRMPGPGSPLVAVVSAIEAVFFGGAIWYIVWR